MLHLSAPLHTVYKATSLCTIQQFKLFPFQSACALSLMVQHWSTRRFASRPTYSTQVQSKVMSRCKTVKTKKLCLHLLCLLMQFAKCNSTCFCARSGRGCGKTQKKYRKQKLCAYCAFSVFSAALQNSECGRRRIGFLGVESMHCNSLRIKSLVFIRRAIQWDLI